MKKQTQNQNQYRWFIWTIVFLIVSGVSLVSYIMITDMHIDAQAITDWPVQRMIK